MEISQYIRDLLFTHDRVILSDFGAFVAKYQPAKIDEKTNTMMPPGKKVVFDPTVTKDGGLLRDYMVKQESISSDDAEKQIVEYVKTIKSKLNAGKKVKFTELGSFVKLKDDQLLFTYAPAENLLTDSFGMTSVDLPEESGQKFAMQEQTAPEAKHTENKSKKRYRGALIFIIIMALIVLAGTAIYFLRPQWMTSGKEYVSEMFEKNSEPADNEGSETDTHDGNANNTDNNTSPDTENTDNNDGSNETVIPESTDGGKDTKPDDAAKKTTDNYSNVDMSSPKRGYSYLVVASLPTPEAAEEERKRLKSKGINTSIIPAGKTKYRLSVGEFKNFQEATAYYNEFHVKHKLETWLWEY